MSAKYFVHIILFLLYCDAFPQENKTEEFISYDADKFVYERYEKGKPTGNEEVLGIKVTITRDTIFNKLMLIFVNSDREIEMESYTLKKAKSGEYIFPSLSPGSYHFSSYNGTLNTGYHLLTQKDNTFFVFHFMDNQIQARYKFTNVKLSKNNQE